MICTCAQVSGDKLQLMGGCRSMRSLLLCFKVCMVPAQLSIARPQEITILCTGFCRAHEGAVGSGQQETKGTYSAACLRE